MASIGEPFDDSLYDPDDCEERLRAFFTQYPDQIKSSEKIKEIETIKPEHTHKWEVRNGKYGGFLFCIECKKTLAAYKNEPLFRRLCTYKPSLLEQVIQTSYSSRGN